MSGSAIKDMNKSESFIKKKKDKDPFYFPHKPIGQTAAILYTIFGFLFTLGFGIPVFVLTLVGGNGSVIFGLAMPLLLGLLMDLNGFFLFRRLKRYKRYMNLFKGRSFCFVDELADFCNLDEAYVLKDLKKMLFNGTFPDAHIAEEDTLILLTRHSYDQYVFEQRKRKMIQRDMEDREKTLGILDERDEIIKEGRAFIQEVKEANKAIDDMEVTDKVNRLEDIISHIINYIEKHPEQKGNVRRFIQYYLPSTVKLLNTYSELEKQSIQGENIIEAKKEIKEILDTINKAFETLFNNLFAGISIDISTDITVLQSMLAKEGLTEKEFDIS